MKESLKKFNYLILIVIILFQITLVNTEEEDEDPENMVYYVHFDLSNPDLIFIPNKNNETEIKDIISKSSSNRIPDVRLDLEYGFFSGWTEDWVYGYLPGEVFVSTHKNTTLYPVLGLLDDRTTYTLKYVVEFEGESINPLENLGHYVKNRIVQTSMRSFPNEKATHRGWTDGEHEFVQGKGLVMPAHNVTLTALFYYYRNLTYVAGDVDDVVGAQNDIQTMRAGGVKDLAESTRLARKGYEMIGWHCENDGNDYPFFHPYIMPDENVIMTAIWKPINYVLVFNNLVSSAPNPRLQGETNTKILAPKVEVERNGYTFEGWSLYENQIYLPGDEIVIKGQLPGTGITIKAVWVPN
jgi:hypothetical protein